LVVTPPSVIVPLVTSVFVTAPGVIVRPTSSVTTEVEVKVMSGDVTETVMVAFSTLVFVTSAAVIDNVSVSLAIVVDVTSGAVINVLVVSFSTTVVVVKAVTTGRLLVSTGVEEALGTTDALMVDEIGPQVCAEPIPTENG
jgi:hypothetical protein